MITPLLWRASLRYHLRHPWQLGLALLGIGLGVAVVLGVDLANDSARASFRLSLDRITGETTHRILAQDGDLEEALFGRLRRELGVQPAVPVVTGYASFPAYPGKVVQVLGWDPLSWNNLPVMDDMDSLARRDPLDWSRLLAGEALALFPPELAQVPALEVRAGQQTLHFERLGSLEGPSLEGLMVVDITVAQTLLGKVGRLSHIDLILDETQDGPLMDRIRDLLPPGVALARAAERNQALEDLSRSFRLNLMAMSLLALLVGMFLIYNTMTFSVIQRRDLFGRLRVLGVTRRELVGLILGESLALGLLGLGLGVLMGLWLASGLTTLVTRTMDDLYYTLTLSHFVISPWSMAKAVVLGLGATLGAAVLPAWEAASAPPTTVLSRSDLEARWRRMIPTLVVLSLGLAVTGWLVFSLTSGLLAAFVGLFLWLLAMALLVPGSLVLAQGVLEPLLQWVPSWLRMAVRDVVRHLSRTGVAVAALAVAFAATLGVALMIGSFRGGVSLWLEDLLSADYYLAPASLEAGDRESKLTLSTLQAIAVTPGVADMGYFSSRGVMLGQRRSIVLGLEIPARARSAYRFRAGDPGTAWEAVVSGQGILVSEPLAYHLNLEVGETLGIPSPEGAREFQVVGIFHDYASEHGRILMDLSRFQALWPDEGISSVGIYAEKNIDPDTLRSNLEKGPGSQQALAIRASGEILDLSLDIFEQTFAITGILRLLAVVIAFVGLMSSLLALSLERTRELAILRAIGMTPLELARQILSESAYQGLLAGLLSLPIGTVLAAVLIQVINRRAFGWTLPFQVDPLLLAQTLGLALLAAVLAAVYPCYRLIRVDPAGELRGE